MTSPATTAFQPAAATTGHPARPYWNPYVAGVALGLVLLTTYAVMGHGIGASGAIAATAAAGMEAAAPAHAEANGYWRSWISSGNPLASWIVFEVAGMLIGGFLSAWLAGRWRREVERGPHTVVRSRVAWGFAGGALMGFASRLARGCTSGQALTGGAVLSVGSWLFMLSLFAAGYAVAPLLRRQWR